MSFNMMHMPGPCVICGDTNYSLSCGGPTICPKCDCGNFDAATVLKQAKVIAELRKAVNNHEALVKALRLARARIEYLGIVHPALTHFEANEKTFLPAIDEVLNGPVGGPAT